MVQFFNTVGGVINSTFFVFIVHFEYGLNLPQIFWVTIIILNMAYIQSKPSGNSTDYSGE